LVCNVFVLCYSVKLAALALLLADYQLLEVFVALRPFFCFLLLPSPSTSTAFLVLFTPTDASRKEKRRKTSTPLDPFLQLRQPNKKREEECHRACKNEKTRSQAPQDEVAKGKKNTRK
jgi:hypothetical protein